MNEDVPAQLLAPLEFRRAEGSTRYAPWAGGPITAVEVAGLDARLGWLWWSDAESAAGWVTDHRTGPAPVGVVFTWTSVWESVANAGHAPSALPTLVGEIDPNAGIPQWGSVAQTTLAALQATAGQTRTPLPSVAHLALEALSGDSVSGATLDAGLRGQFPMSDAMREQVDSLDAALRRKPVPETMVVARGTSLAAWPGEPEALWGERLIENAYFPTRLGTIDPDGIDAVVHLRVPAGVPAMYTAPEGRPERGILILARGLEWTVDTVERAPSGTVILSATVQREENR